MGLPQPPRLMKASTYDFRQFQEELAALDGKDAPPTKARPLSRQDAARTRLSKARTEFLAIRERYELTVADVVAFFPEEEGVAYLQKLIAEKDARPKRSSGSRKS